MWKHDELKPEKKTYYTIHNVLIRFKVQKYIYIKNNLYKNKLCMPLQNYHFNFITYNTYFIYVWGD